MRLDRALRSRVDEGVRPLVEREDDLSRRLDALAARVDQLADRVDRIDQLPAALDLKAAAVDLKNVSERVDRLDEVTGSAEDRLRRLDEQATWNAHQISRLAPQAASFEQRLERQARPVVVNAGGNDELSESRMLVDVVREEHARIRARLSAVSAYEERIRRLEDRAFPPPTG
ncbi:hypothetical protein [Blastococcus sp. VKM Ac-2987]|uniref:hypothetical protein n=1 Tax=Blastococcus sp. VKM Ac-2987 TaxID=3004141 RepID=UPI0022AB55E2|nr:hypothetical protein [Blastococcus sp. VKM Ac-2987]MCZ2859539.1 hypothetical protein [Blastococcus sp. VKM Ac-2987]